MHPHSKYPYALTCFAIASATARSRFKELICDGIYDEETHPYDTHYFGSDSHLEELHTFLNDIKGKIEPNKTLCTTIPEGRLQIGSNKYKLKEPTVVSGKRGKPSDTTFFLKRKNDFLRQLKDTAEYKRTFDSKNLSVEPNSNYYDIENFANLGFTVEAKPDFVVVDKTTGKFVGFAEYKIYRNCFHLYNNIYHRDLMKLAVYSLINKRTNFRSTPDSHPKKVPFCDEKPRCWIFQVSSRDVVIGSEILSSEYKKITDGMFSQVHKEFYDIQHRKGRDSESAHFRYFEIMRHVNKLRRGYNKVEKNPYPISKFDHSRKIFPKQNAEEAAKRESEDFAFYVVTIITYLFLSLSMIIAFS